MGVRLMFWGKTRSRISGNLLLAALHGSLRASIMTFWGRIEEGQDKKGSKEREIA